MKSLGQNGVTIFELLISVGIAAVLITVLMSISLGFYGSTIRSQVTAEMAIDSHFMLRAMVEDLRLGHNIGVTSVLPDPNAPGGGWATSDPDNVLIINKPATTADNDIVYDSSTGDPYNNEYIYFIESNTLKKRLIKNASAPGNNIASTCPTYATSSSCPSDRIYSSYVDNMSFTFYDENNATTTSVSLARSVAIKLSMSRKIFGKTVTFNNSILTKLRN